jgi:hypothetical protein
MRDPAATHRLELGILPGVGGDFVNPMIKLGGFVILIAIVALAAYLTGASLGPVAVRSGRDHGPMYMGGLGQTTGPRIRLADGRRLRLSAGPW